MKASDIRNHIAASCGYTEPSKAGVSSSVALQPEADNERNETREDIGGNFVPDRIEANEDRYWEEEL